MRVLFSFYLLYFRFIMCPFKLDLWILLLESYRKPSEISLIIGIIALQLIYFYFFYCVMMGCAPVQDQMWNRPDWTTTPFFWDRDWFVPILDLLLFLISLLLYKFIIMYRLHTLCKDFILTFSIILLFSMAYFAFSLVLRRFLKWVIPLKFMSNSIYSY